MTSSTNANLRRSGRWAWLTIAWLLAVLLAMRGAAAQEPKAAPPAQTPGVTVDLGTADSPPGRTVSVPMNVGVPDGIVASAVEVDVHFDKRLLDFVRVDVTPEGTAASITVTHTIDKEPDDEQGAILKLKVSGPEPLRSMAVADLFFRINTRTKLPGGSTGHKAAKITAVLKRQAKAKIGEGEGTLVDAIGRDGEIDITAGTAIFGCFFYMH